MQDDTNVVNEPVNPSGTDTGAEAPASPSQPATPVEGETPGQGAAVEKTNIPVEEVSRTGEQVVHNGEQPAGSQPTE